MRYSVVFDLWSSPWKDSFLSVIVVALFVEAEERVLTSGKRKLFSFSVVEKFTLDTLPLLNEQSHDNISYNESIHAVLTNYGWHSRIWNAMFAMELM